MIKKIHKSENPREKALKNGISVLSNTELLAIILRHGNAQNNVLEIADKLILTSSGFHNIVNLTIEDLLEISGIGTVKALELLSVLEIAKRLNDRSQLQQPHLWTYKEIYKFIINSGYNNEQEYFWIFIFNNNNKLLKSLHWIGNHHKLQINQNKLLKQLINYENSKIIIAHNHPSGIDQFSATDQATTLSLSQKLSIFNIKLINHILICKNKYKLFWYNNIDYF